MKTLARLFALLASIFLTLAVSAAEAKTPTPPPPIASLPPAGDTAPPADAIVDFIAPITSCSGWYRQSYYGGRWATDSTWWEYLCGACIPGCATNESTSFRYDYYVWDGSRPVYYGQSYTESNMDGDGDPCSYWWDEATSQWYGPYACIREIDAYPTASFTINCSALRCSVDGSGSADSDGTIAYYLWYFGDFTDQSSGISAEHLFASAGSYTVTLAVTDDLGLVGYAQKTVAVGTPNAAPSASFTVNCSGLNCSFDGSGSADSDGTIQTYSWDFGDGASGIGKTAQHRYTQSGGYTATLTVSDDGGATATASHVVAVTNAAPTAAFTVSCSGLTCSFDANGSADSDGTIESYRWDFGDGTSGAGKLVQHTYGQPRSYSVGLAVTDNDGATATVSKTLNPISLSARGYKQKGFAKVDLAWSGSIGASFDVYRNGGKIATLQANAYTDSLNTKGSGSYAYKVCAAASSTCSNQVTVNF
jgi:PKD repeat protein